MPYVVQVSNGKYLARTRFKGATLVQKLDDAAVYSRKSTATAKAKKLVDSRVIEVEILEKWRG